METVTQQLFVPQAPIKAPDNTTSAGYFCTECNEEHTRVTSMLRECLPKPALVPWAEGVGRSGVIELARQGLDIASMTPEAIKDALKAAALTTEDAKRSGGDRGSQVHQFIENYFVTGTLPDADAYDDVARPYLVQLAKFILDYKPTFLASEVKLVSHEYGFAGQTDGICLIGEQPSRRNKPVNLAGKRCLFDAKTNRAGRVYKREMFYQVACYEYAWREMGGEPNDHQIVLALGQDKYQLAVSTFPPDLAIDLATFYRRTKLAEAGELTEE